MKPKPSLSLITDLYARIHKELDPLVKQQLRDEVNQMWLTVGETWDARILPRYFSPHYDLVGIHK